MQLQIRAERPGDERAIHQIHQEAFRGEAEAKLVEALRASDAFIPELSLLALRGGRPVGHVMLSRIHVRGNLGVVAALALAPMAVIPEAQRQGVGTALIQEALSEARSLQQGLVLVLGHSEYYPRFGFKPARELGIRSRWSDSDHHFFVLPLREDALEGVEGEAVYPRAFDGL